MKFKDVGSDRWDAYSIDVVSSRGLMSGYPDGTFRPDQFLRRGEFASALHRWMFRDGLFDDILPKVMPSVVMVHRGDALGSGACVALKDGVSYVLTNAHVVGDKDTFTLIKDDGSPNFEGKLFMKSPDQDLAIVTTSRELPPLEVSTELVLGQPVAIIGAPFGYTETVTVGVVSNLNRGDFVQIDAPISPGSSGGPMIDERGRLVAVVVAKVVDIAVEGIGFAIKPQYVKDFLSRTGVL